MTKTYTQSISEDNLSHKNILSIIIIQLQLKKQVETLCVAINCFPSYSIATLAPITFCFSRLGKYCPHRDRLEEIDCPAGSFSTGGQFQCTQCAAGFKCTDKTTNSQVQFLSRKNYWYDRHGQGELQVRNMFFRIISINCHHICIFTCICDSVPIIDKRMI